jgi:hypothetical protein
MNRQLSLSLRHWYFSVYCHSRQLADITPMLNIDAITCHYAAIAIGDRLMAFSRRHFQPIIDISGILIYFIAFVERPISVRLR